MLRLSFLAIAVALAATALATLTSFQADIAITNDPQLQGTMKGVMYYQYDSEGKQSFRRIDFKVAGGIVNELIDYQQNTRYLNCTSCQAESYKNGMEKFFYDSSTDSPAAGDMCTSVTRTNGANGISALSVSKTMICSAQYSTGKTITFSNYNQKSLSSSLFDASGWHCPAKKCNSIMNLAIILDESWSIDWSEWSEVKTFAKNLVDMYTVGEDAVWIGIGTFSENGRLIMNLEHDSQYIKGMINSITPVRENTCIGCGIAMATEIFKNGKKRQSADRLAKNPKNVMILMTDGGNNRPCHLSLDLEGDRCSVYNFHHKEADDNLTAATQTLRTGSVYSIALGVGNELVEDQLRSFSDVYIKADSFYTLSTVLGNLLTTTCQDFPESPCGASCKGFCGCNVDCECPTECPVKDACTISKCSYGPNGCVDTTKTCDDNNKCTDDTCDTVSGCKYTAFDVKTRCANSNKCKIPQCNPSQGCFWTDKTCTPSDKCHTSVCNTATGTCDETKISCDDNNECTIDACDPLKGCTHVVNCDDGNPCTDDKCLNKKCDHNTPHDCTSPDYCQIGTCDTKVGCVYSKRDCADTDVCTYDTCDKASSKCLHTKAGDECSYCAQAPPTCEDKKCATVSCKDNLVTRKGECVWNFDVSSSAHYCNDGNPCTNDECDAATGVCTHHDRTNATCVPQQKNMCFPQKCDQTTGNCVEHPVTCTASSACFTAQCDPATGKCYETSICLDPVCQVCNVVNGQGVCTAKCPNLNCSTATCNNGICNYTAISCDDHDFCTIDTCDPASGCVYTPNPCDDGNPCTRDFCNTSTQKCNSTALCYDGKWCTDDVCVTDPNNPTNATCKFPRRSCSEIGLDGPERECFAADCSEKYTKCYKKLLNSSLADACGSCVKTYDPQKRRDTGCIGALGWKTATAVITGGVIAGIVIAAVVGFLIFAAVSSYGTWKLVQMSKMGQGMAAHNNPMYKPSDQESVNPAYSQR
eukprot:m51a1_g1498 hypothetical protein (982) ;mRNA; r:331153-335037